jgi:hypothetical protein
MDYLQNKLPGEVKDLGLLSLPVGILGTEAPGSPTVVPETVCTTLYSHDRMCYATYPWLSVYSRTARYLQSTYLVNEPRKFLELHYHKTIWANS